jgi:ubiquinone/menaquinone biosynthesis C-methylase UbiE
MQGVTYKADIQDMNEIADNTYDVWICSHVLEHIPDDRKALSELYRILKPGGIGLLLVPLDLSREETDEENGCSEAENWRRFGQGDHVRAYAKKDFMNRVVQSGFGLQSLGREYFGDDMFNELGLTATSTIYVCRKPVSK